MVHGSVSLNLGRALVETWLGADVAVCSYMLLHLDSPLFGVAVYRFTKGVISARRLTLLCTRQRTHVFHQTPNVIRCLYLTEGWHSCESDAVLDDPKQLPIGVALHSPTGEICGAWVHPLPRWRFGQAVDPVAYAAIQAEMCTSGFNTGSCVNRRRGNSVAAGQANDRVFGQIRYACFKRARFLQCRQTDMHPSNPDQHHTRGNRCPNDSRPHYPLVRCRLQSRGVHRSLLQLRDRKEI